MDWEPEVTFAGEPVDTVGNAVDVPCEVRLVPIERRRPVVTEGARIEETRTIHEAGGGKEDAVAVGGSHQSSVDSGPIVVRLPGPGTLCP